MNRKKSWELEKEYQAFCSNLSDDANTPASSKLKDMAADIKNNLVSSRIGLAVYYLLLSVLGYFATLMICAQNGIGISSFSHHANETLMHFLPHPWCAVLCGSLFSGGPFLLSLFFLNRFQHKFLLFRMPWLLLMTPILASLGFQFLGFQSGNVLYFWESSFERVWVISAILTPYILELFLALKLRQRLFSKA